MRKPTVLIGHPPFVYFFQDAVDASLPIKIGFARDVSGRLASAQTGYWRKLKILGVVRGEREKEEELHDRFVGARVFGEWFSPVPDLLDLILKEAKDLDVVLEEIRVNRDIFGPGSGVAL